MAKEVIEFDKNNPQDDYQYMAKNIETGKYEIGYIVIDKPWYSNSSDWTYYIVKNKYGSGFCGGATDLGLEKVIVDSTSVESYTQIAQIKYNQSIGMDSVLVKDFLGDDEDKNNIVAFIGANDDIPLELWS